MSQLTLGDFMALDKELILCSLSSGYHWIRISSGDTPSAFLEKVHFALNGYDYLYEGSQGKDEIVSEFNGRVRELSWSEDIE